MVEINPSTQWSELNTRFFVHPRRKTPDNFPILVAAYLPHDQGAIDWKSFEQVLRRIFDAGCIPVLNADTGFCFHLTPEQKVKVVRRALEWFPGRRFVVGVTPGGGDTSFEADAYRRAIDEVMLNDHIDVMLMISPGLMALQGNELIAAYAAIDNIPYERAIVHELTGEFASFGRMFTPYELRGVLSLPQFWGMKTSVLAGDAVARRITLRSQQEDMRGKLILSGVDWQLRDAFELADGILMGAAVLFPQVFRKLHELRKKVDEDFSLTPMYEHILANVQSIVYFQFLPYTGHDDRINVGGYRHFTGKVLTHLGVITSCAPPHDTDSARQELRPPGEFSQIGPLLTGLEVTLKAFGERIEDWVPELDR